MRVYCRYQSDNKKDVDEIWITHCEVRLIGAMPFFRLSGELHVQPGSNGCMSNEASPTQWADSIHAGDHHARVNFRDL